MQEVDGWYEIHALVRNRLGLHGRPAKTVVDKAQQFASEIRFNTGNDESSGKSIVEIIALGATKDTELLIRARGVDACQAVATLKELIEERLIFIDEVNDL